MVIEAMMIQKSPTFHASTRAQVPKAFISTVISTKAAEPLEMTLR